MFGSADASLSTFIRSDPEQKYKILFGFFSVVGHEHRVLLTTDYNIIRKDILS